MENAEIGDGFSVKLALWEAAPAVFSRIVLFFGFSMINNRHGSFYA